MVVVVEVLAVVALGLLAHWCWQRGVIVMATERIPLDRVDGAWWGAATAAATLAGLLLLHAALRVTRFGAGAPAGAPAGGPGVDDRHG